MEKELESHPCPKQIHVVDFAGYHEVMSEPFYEACNLLNESSNAMAETFARNLEHYYNNYQKVKAANTELTEALEQLMKFTPDIPELEGGTTWDDEFAKAIQNAESLISKHKAQ